jgi:hypothetical protein
MRGFLMTIKKLHSGLLFGYQKGDVSKLIRLYSKYWAKSMGLTSYGRANAKQVTENGIQKPVRVMAKLTNPPLLIYSNRILSK